VRIKIWSNSVFLIAILFLFVLPVQAVETKFIGEVNDTYQLVTDDQIYEIDENEIGNTLVYDHKGERVEVTGTLKEVNGLKVIAVTSFVIISE
jgi:hypothetical protein